MLLDVFLRFDVCIIAGVTPLTSPNTGGILSRSLHGFSLTLGCVHVHVKLPSRQVARQPVPWRPNVEGAIRTRHLNIWKPRGFVQLPVDRCLPAPGIALLDRSTVFTVWGEARRHAQAFRHLTGDRSSKRAYRVRTRTLHLQSFDPWLRQGSTSWTTARRWIFESWLVGLLRCRLVLRHARVPWSCFSRACYFRHDVKPCQ